MPIDIYAALADGGFIVKLRPAEFSRFALAVAHVRSVQAKCQAVKA